ncbi:MAG: ribosome maturation factor RimP [Acidimicrobiaceae bacterium]
MSIVERVREVVEPLLERQSLTVYDVEHSGSSLRITVDAPGGVDLGAIARATRIISVALDEHDPIPSKYTLEVSSPGLERPLRTPAHYAGAVGTTISVKTNARVDGERRIKGTLVAADADGITVGDHPLRYDDIEKARTVFEWGPAPKPGQTKPAADKKKAKASS